MKTSVGLLAGGLLCLICGGTTLAQNQGWGSGFYCKPPQTVTSACQAFATCYQFQQFQKANCPPGQTNWVDHFTSFGQANSYCYGGSGDCPGVFQCPTQLYYTGYGVPCPGGFTKVCDDIVWVQGCTL